MCVSEIVSCVTAGILCVYVFVCMLCDSYVFVFVRCVRASGLCVLCVF
jgi:hypothetical protein